MEALWTPPEKRLWTPPAPRTERGARRRPFERRFARSRTGLWHSDEFSLWLTPSITQTNSTQSGSSTVGCTFTNAQKSGNAIVALFAGQSATVTGWTVSDTESNTYNLITLLQSVAAGYSVFAWVAFGIKAAGVNVNQVTTSVTGTFGFSELVVLEITGASSVDTKTVATGASASSGTGTTGPATTSYPNELMLCYNANNSNATGPGTGWTDALGGVTGFGSECEYQTTTSTGAIITGTVPINSSTNWIQVMLGLVGAIIVPFSSH